MYDLWRICAVPWGGEAASPRKETSPTLTSSSSNATFRPAKLIWPTNRDAGGLIFGVAWSVCDLLSKYLYLRYWNEPLTDQNSVQEAIKSRLKLGNACYHSVKNLLSSRLLSKNLKIKIYRTIILPVVCMGVKPGRWHWGRNADWGCLRIVCWGEYLVLRGTRWRGNGESCITRSWMICTPYPVLCGW
jgi:hypothetical protein